MNGRNSQAAKANPDRRRGCLWLFALVFVLLAANWARFWAPSARYAWSKADVEAFASSIGKGASPLLVAILLIVFLWKTVGLPFSRPRARSPEFWTGREHSAVEVSYGSVFWRDALWVVMCVLLFVSAGWALLCVTCAIDGPGYLFNGYRASELWALGLKPLILVVVLALLLWGVIGPPFARHRRQ